MPRLWGNCQHVQILDICIASDDIFSSYLWNALIWQNGNATVQIWEMRRMITVNTNLSLQDFLIETIFAPGLSASQTDNTNSPNSSLRTEQFLVKIFPEKIHFALFSFRSGHTKWQISNNCSLIEKIFGTTTTCRLWQVYNWLIFEM